MIAGMMAKQTRAEHLKRWHFAICNIRKCEFWDIACRSLGKGLLMAF
jgi:hypothetical protein